MPTAYSVFAPISTHFRSVETTLHRQLEEVRALKQVTAFPFALGHARRLPILQVGRREELNAVSLVGGDIQDHDPLFRQRMPNDLRVAVARRDLPDDRVLVVPDEIAAIETIRQALRGRVAGGGEDQDKRWIVSFAESAGIVAIDDRAAAEDGAHRVGPECIAELSSQWIRSLLTAWPQCMFPQSQPYGLCWKNR